jgi:hypothetical protein
LLLLTVQPEPAFLEVHQLQTTETAFQMEILFEVEEEHVVELQEYGLVVLLHQLAE